jgi:hypothetical protein
MTQNGIGVNGNTRPRGNLPGNTADDAGLVLDEELASAAAPFLYLLSSIVIAAGAYFLYALLRG